MNKGGLVILSPGSNILTKISLAFDKTTKIFSMANSNVS